jgi:hypothetical protein
VRSLSTPFVRKFILEGIKWSAEPAMAEKGKKP